MGACTLVAPQPEVQVVLNSRQRLGKQARDRECGYPYKPECPRIRKPHSSVRHRQFFGDIHPVDDLLIVVQSRITLRADLDSKSSLLDMPRINTCREAPSLPIGTRHAWADA